MPGLSGVIMMKKISTLFAALLLAVTLSGAAAVPASAQSKKASASERVSQPLNLAVLIQDDLVARVGNELRVTADFIRGLPAGSTVMVGSIRTGSLQVRQPFTNDLGAAAGALRIPVGSTPRAGSTTPPRSIPSTSTAPCARRRTAASRSTRSMHPRRA